MAVKNEDKPDHLNNVYRPHNLYTGRNFYLQIYVLNGTHIAALPHCIYFFDFQYRRQAGISTTRSSMPSSSIRTSIYILKSNLLDLRELPVGRPLMITLVLKFPEPSKEQSVVRLTSKHPRFGSASQISDGDTWFRTITPLVGEFYVCSVTV